MFKPEAVYPLLPLRYPRVTRQLTALSLLAFSTGYLIHNESKLRDSVVVESSLTNNVTVYFLLKKKDARYTFKDQRKVVSISAN